jgi:topoisomerase IA-like protein
MPSRNPELPTRNNRKGSIPDSPTSRESCECQTAEKVAAASSSPVIPASKNTKLLGKDQKNNVLLKKGPYGWYIELEGSEDKKGKPKRSPKRLPHPGVVPRDFVESRDGPSNRVE